MPRPSDTKKNIFTQKNFSFNGFDEHVNGRVMVWPPRLWPGDRAYRLGVEVEVFRSFTSFSRVSPAGGVEASSPSLASAASVIQMLATKLNFLVVFSKKNKKKIWKNHLYRPINQWFGWAESFLSYFMDDGKEEEWIISQIYKLWSTGDLCGWDGLSMLQIFSRFSCVKWKQFHRVVFKTLYHCHFNQRWFFLLPSFLPSHN